jgi:ABC-type nitrate/sulfonate/bicarbonate transport system permease component
MARANAQLPSLVADIVAPAAVLVALVLLWEWLCKALDVPVFILPKPSDIVAQIVHDRELLWGDFLFTLKNVLFGFLLAFVVAMVLGFLVAHVRLINRAIYPLLVASQTIPIIAIAPVFIIWFGYGILPKVITTALICFFPLTVNTVTGFQSVDPEMKTLFRAYNAGWAQTALKLTFPGALPFIMSGLKISATLSVIGGVIGEWIGSDNGLGYLIIQAGSQIQTARVFAAIAVLALMGIALFLLAALLERLVTPWQRATRPAS